MSGNSTPGSIGADLSAALIDAGTSALTRTPDPFTVGGNGMPGASGFLGSAPDVPMSGGVLYSIGQSSVVRIPVPGTNRLAIELSPRGWTPQGGSTSTLFLQDPTGRRHLRLDYGYNARTRTIDYHWNQKGTSNQFGIADHTPAGSSGKTAYQAAKYFKYAGRILVVAGVAVDAVSIVQVSNRLRRASQVVAGWAAARAGCKVVGAGGAVLGLSASPLGSAAAGIGGCIVGGIAGYAAGSHVGGEVYDWAEGTFFSPLPETDAP